MLRVIRADRLTGLLALHVVGVALHAVLAAEGLETVGPADQEPARAEGHQHADVVLTALLRKKRKMSKHDFFTLVFELF